MATTLDHRRHVDSPLKDLKVYKRKELGLVAGSATRLAVMTLPTFELQAYNVDEARRQSQSFAGTATLLSGMELVCFHCCALTGVHLGYSLQTSMLYTWQSPPSCKIIAYANNATPVRRIKIQKSGFSIVASWA